IQFSLPTLLELVDQGLLSKEIMVELTSHAHARLFSNDKRGYLRRGYKADITIFRPETRWVVNEDNIQSKCKWIPMQGH
ncbi:UNVERIFIED_CONTAM: dihydroorotase, partial [Prevotella sp. 15_C9]